LNEIILLFNVFIKYQINILFFLIKTKMHSTKKTNINQNFHAKKKTNSKYQSTINKIEIKHISTASTCHQNNPTITKKQRTKKDSSYELTFQFSSSVNSINVFSLSTNISFLHPLALKPCNLSSSFNWLTVNFASLFLSYLIFVFFTFLFIF